MAFTHKELVEEARLILLKHFDLNTAPFAVANWLKEERRTAKASASQGGASDE